MTGAVGVPTFGLGSLDAPDHAAAGHSIQHIRLLVMRLQIFALADAAFCSNSLITKPPVFCKRCSILPYESHFFPQGCSNISRLQGLPVDINQVRYTVAGAIFFFFSNTMRVELAAHHVVDFLAFLSDKLKSWN
jgi:hypothetical protein